MTVQSHQKACPVCREEYEAIKIMHGRVVLLKPRWWIVAGLYAFSASCFVLFTFILPSLRYAYFYCLPFSFLCMAAAFHVKMTRDTAGCWCCLTIGSDSAPVWRIQSSDSGSNRGAACRGQATRRGGRRELQPVLSVCFFHEFRVV